MDEPDPEHENAEQELRRQRISRILRRRKRAAWGQSRKPKSIKGRAEFGNFTFTPSGAVPTKWRWLLPLSIFLTTLFPIFITIIARSRDTEHESPIVEYMMLGLGYLMLGLFALSLLMIPVWLIWSLFEAHRDQPPKDRNK